jgi:diguanylate cyclase (GGDEF)-like protein
MEIRFWGTRGSIPTPGPTTAHYGGNTSCVELRVSDGTVILLDCGTGARALGQKLLQEGVRRIHLLIGHTHWDHIHGFPFFTPAALPESELNIYAPAGFQRSLEDALAGQMQYSYFPVKLDDLSGRIHFTELEEGLFRIGDVLVETQYLNHTAPTIAYRISRAGATLAYVTDHEPFWSASGNLFQHPGDQRHVEFLKDADLIIHDAQYTVDEYRTKRGWGHSTIDYATDVAIAAKARRLALFHHDPVHDDQQVAQLEKHARERAQAAGSKLEIFAAAEGMSVELEETGAERTLARASALARRPIRGGRVMLVGGTAADVTAVELTLSEEDLRMVTANNGEAAIERTTELPPDLVILDSNLSDGNAANFVAPLRDAAGRAELPILILTTDPNEQSLDNAGTTGADYLVRPYSPPMLRSRVRAWLARTMAGADQATERISPRTTTQVPVSQVLASAELFASLKPADIEQLLTRSSQRVYPKGYVVINQGEYGHSVYVILSGRVRIAESLPDSSVETFVTEKTQGDVFGELSVLPERTRSMTAIALERTTCLIIPEADFLDVLHSRPETALSLARAVAKRLLEADRALAHFGPDPLTGLPGRRAFHELYRRVSAGPRRRGASVLLVLIDIVKLRAINDQYGYKVGDELLRAVADALAESSRGTDLIARYGADEFAALFVEAGAGNVDVVKGRIREKFRNMIQDRGLPAEAKLRMGFAVGEKAPESVDDLLRDADAGFHD